MEMTQYMNEGELRVLASTYDSVYLHPVWMRTMGSGNGSNSGIPHSHAHPHWGKKLSG
jgi:hypothetical protein